MIMMSAACAEVGRRQLSIAVSSLKGGAGSSGTAFSTARVQTVKWNT
jgi:hypothetical protein